MVRLELDSRIISLIPRSSNIWAPTPKTRNSPPPCPLNPSLARTLSESVVRLGLADEDHHAPALFGDYFHGPVEFLGLVGAAAPQNVVEDIEGVHARQDRAGSGEVSLHQGHVLGVGGFVGEDDHAELAAVEAVQGGFQDTLDNAVVAQPVGDEVGDGGDLDAMELGEFDQVRHAGHGPVLVHDLADHAGRVEPRQAGHVHRRLGVSGALKHAARLRSEGEHVAGADDVVRALGGVDGGGDGARPVGSGNACAHPFSRLDGHREGRLVARFVVVGH